MHILVTGAVGFIGFHLSKRLLENGHRVIGIDNLIPYYDPALKDARLAILLNYPNFDFHRMDIANRKEMGKVFSCKLQDKGKRANKLKRPQGPKELDYIIHLAAQAGVRYSLTNPYVYIESNVVGFLNILEVCRQSGVRHLVFASSSSVYGLNRRMPFSVRHNVDHPVSLYAATKKADELMAHTYAYLYNIPTTGLRFFTVYGPWGRPDMAYFKFTEAIINDRPIEIYNYGRMKRDFTYIDDVIEGIVRVMDKIPKPNPTWRGENPDPSSSVAPYRLYNIGNNHPVELIRFIELLEGYIGKKAKKVFLPMQLGDVPETYADVDDLEREVGFRPATSIEEGLKRFVEWYREYYSHTRDISPLAIKG